MMHVQLQYYIPPENHINKEFLKQLFAEDKKAFKLSFVSFINVPVLDEISVKNIMEMVKNDELVCSYLPDEYLQNKTPDRQFLMNIVNSLYPQYLEQLDQHACQMRQGKHHHDDKNQKILASDFWVSELS